jgi:hypothetical protein
LPGALGVVDLGVGGKFVGLIDRVYPNACIEQDPPSRPV